MSILYLLGFLAFCYLIAGRGGFFAFWFIKNLKLESKGFEIELEIIAKLSKIKTYIFELPVNFLPRSKEHGKKITFLDGMKSIWIIIKNGF